MKLDEYNDGESYWRIACDCLSPNHDVSLYFKTDHDCKSLNLNLEMELSSNNPYDLYNNVGDSKWYWLEWLRDNALWRIKTAAKILFMGRIEVSGDAILSQDGIDAMKTALVEGEKYANEILNQVKTDIDED